MVVLVVGVCVGALAFVVLAIFALDLWQRVGRLATEVARAQERTGLAVLQLQRLTEEMSRTREELGSGSAGGSGGSSSGNTARAVERPRR